jgi:hypothetical protein
MVLFKLEMIQQVNKNNFTHINFFANKSNTIKLIKILYTINKPKNTPKVLDNIY